MVEIAAILTGAICGVTASIPISIGILLLLPHLVPRQARPAPTVLAPPSSVIILPEGSYREVHHESAMPRVR